MIPAGAVISMTLVAALWGCTNPLLRQGAVNLEQSKSKTTSGYLANLIDVRVWLPFLLNQLGSVLFYIQLAQTELTMAGPFCNGLSLVFSFISSAFLGEENNHPIRAIIGSAFVVLGVGICVTS